MLHCTARVTLMACMMIAIASSSVLADCPTPSFVAVTKRSCSTCGVQSFIDSKSPLFTIHVSSSAPENERALYHGGDVQPTSPAFFDYIDVNTGSIVRSWVTAFSRPNGVIHHEGERLVMPQNAGMVLEVVARWLDECTHATEHRTIGFVEIQ